MASVFLSRPLFLRFRDQDFVRAATKRLFKSGRGAAQTRAQIREQFHRKRKLKLAFKPDWHLTDGHVRSFVGRLDSIPVRQNSPNYLGREKHFVADALRWIALEWPSSWLRKGDTPKVGRRRHKFNSYVSLPITMPPGRYNPTLDRLSRVLVHENKCLIERNLLIYHNHAPAFAYKVRSGSDDELFARDRLAVHS